MNFFHSCLFLWVNSVTTIVAEYKRCYEEFSLCLIANNDTNVRLNQFEADKWCTNGSSSLAIITNETVQFAIEAFIKDNSDELESDIITNGYRYETDPWMWTEGRRSGTYRNSTTNSNCNYAFLVGSSYGSPYVSFFGEATSKRKFICSFLRHISDYSCQPDHLQLGRRCYKIHVEEVSWFEARSICLRQNGRDLANFDHPHNISSFETEWGDYWIGLRRELWLWWSDRTIKYIKEYSNWDVGNPGLLEGNCLCLRTTTGKWRDCDCKQQYRYICIQDYASGSASTVATSTTKSTTKATTETTITRTKMTTTTTRLKTTQSTTTIIPTVGDSSSQFLSTSTQTLDDNSRTKMSDDKPDNLGLLPAVGIGIACLLVLIFAIAVVAIIKTRRSNRSGYPGRSQGNSAPPTIRKDDTPSTVYAMVVPSANEQVRSPSEKAPNQTVYAELDLVTREKTPGRVVGLPESEYSNSLLVNSVYANIDQTRV